MDNEKIGNLIADLRKKQGLTQQDLGDKVGVGFRAVSKWERGITLPDITIINELSKILGISSDELLTGELKKKEDKEIKDEPKKKNQRILITISIITAIIIVLTSFFIYNNSNKTYTYDIISLEQDKYNIRGKAIFNKDNISVVISEINFRNSEFNNTIITNYEYSFNTGKNLIFGYGYINSIQELEQPIRIKDFFETTKFDFNITTKLTKDEIINKDLNLTFKFLDKNNNEIINKLNIELKQVD